MASGKSGKTTMIFLWLVVVILLSGVCISSFLLNKETKTRQAVEVSLSETRSRAARVEAALKEAEQQIDIYKGKLKDADDRINGLMEDLDFEAGLREQVKAENKKLKESLEAEGQAKVELRQKLTAELDAVQARLAQAETAAADSKASAATLQQQVADLEQKNGDLMRQVKALEARPAAEPAAAPADAPAPVPEEAAPLPAAEAPRQEIIPVPGQPGDDPVSLDRIVVTPETAKEGRVLSVDTDTEFLIFDLGTKHGIEPGAVMSVYRGKSYLGDVKVSRVQEELAAADFIPPFSSRKVRKNDQVVPKK